MPHVPRAPQLTDFTDPIAQNLVLRIMYSLRKAERAALSCDDVQAVGQWSSALAYSDALFVLTASPDVYWFMQDLKQHVLDVTNYTRDWATPN